MQLIDCDIPVDAVMLACSLQPLPMPTCKGYHPRASLVSQSVVNKAVCGMQKTD